MKEYKVGDQVVFVGISRCIAPEYYPPVGTKGTVVSTEDRLPLIRWENGSTSLDDVWFACLSEIRRWQTA